MGQQKQDSGVRSVLDELHAIIAYSVEQMRNKHIAADHAEHALAVAREEIDALNAVIVTMQEEMARLRREVDAGGLPDRA